MPFGAAAASAIAVENREHKEHEEREERPAQHANDELEVWAALQPSASAMIVDLLEPRAAVVLRSPLRPQYSTFLRVQSPVVWLTESAWRKSNAIIATPT